MATSSQKFIARNRAPRVQIEYDVELYGAEKKVQLHYGDLGDTEALISVLGRVMPDEVYNLAAQSHVGISFEMPIYTGDVTGLGTIRLLEAVRAVVPAHHKRAATRRAVKGTRPSVGRNGLLGALRCLPDARASRCAPRLPRRPFRPIK